MPAPNTYRGSGAEPKLDIVAASGDALETTAGPCAGAFMARSDPPYTRVEL